MNFDSIQADAKEAHRFPLSNDIENAYDYFMRLPESSQNRVLFRLAAPNATWDFFKEQGIEFTFYAIERDLKALDVLERINYVRQCNSDEFDRLLARFDSSFKRLEAEAPDLLLKAKNTS